MKKIFILFFLLQTYFIITAQEDYLPSTITRNNAFSLSFYSTVKNAGENLIVSPFGLSNCFAMAYIGSEGKTQQAIADKMNFITPYGILVSYKLLTRRYQIFKNNEVNFLMGNALWIGNEKDLQKKYKNLLKVNFSSHVQDISLKDGFEDGIKEINRWAKKASNFSLLSLIKQEEISPDDELIFTNYLFLDGNWENPFNAQLTSKSDFFLSDGSKKKIDFMNQTSYLRYNENDIFQILELPYSGRNLSMIILLPKSMVYLDSLEKTLNPVNFDFWTSELYTKLVSLSLPKFRIEQTYISAQNKNDKGIEPAFDDKADYSRISKDSIKLSKIIQKTIIQVVENKSGNYTESIGTIDRKNKNTDNTFVRFKADLPFIFVVKDNLNGCILLIGKVNDPNFTDFSADYQD